MNSWLKAYILILISSLLQAASLKEGLNELKENPYGFVLVDMGITQWHLELFDCIDIQKEWVFHQLGDLETIEESIANFICEIGSNTNKLALQAASLLKEISQEVIKGSGKETGWVCLRSFTPIHRFDVPRWHVDGPYYDPDEPNDLLFKFVVTLKGPSTLFYSLPQELRKATEKLSNNRHYMKNFCKQENIVSPKLGQGAIFRGGQYTNFAALHSEPPIHENRLFFSIVPCSEKELPLLKARVSAVYPKDSRN